MQKKRGSKRVLTDKQQQSRDAKLLIDEISRELDRTINKGFTRTHIRNMLIWHFVLTNQRKKYTSDLSLDIAYKTLCNLSFKHTNIFSI